MGLKPHARHPVFDREGRVNASRISDVVGLGRGSSGKPRPKSITVTIGPPSGFNFGPPAPKIAADQADGRDKQYALDQKVRARQTIRLISSSEAAPDEPRRSLASDFCQPKGYD
jgi:hypothetical protein